MISTGSEGTRGDPSPSGLHRKKAPAQVRASILQAASGIASEEGVQAITMDAVASRAGVTKGALQHHFKNKQGLLDALYQEAMDRFASNIDERTASEPADAFGASARAYVLAIVDETKPEFANLFRALVAALMTDPAIRDRYAEPLREWTRPDRLPIQKAARLMIARLAANGLWIATLLGHQEIPKRLRAEILSQLVMMTRGEPEPQG